jgi:hypothetical protein
LSKFIKSYRVFPYATAEGEWSLYIETPWSVGPLGPRFYFGGIPPRGGFDFTDKKIAKDEADKWVAYFQERAKEKKLKQ